MGKDGVASAPTVVTSSSVVSSNVLCLASLVVSFLAKVVLCSSVVYMFTVDSGAGDVGFSVVVVVVTVVGCGSVVGPAKQ